MFTSLLFRDMQIREGGVPMLALFVRVHDREGVPETPACSREGHRAGNQGELRGMRRW